MSSHILIIEDDRILGDILQDKLRLAGYQVSLIEDGAVGLETLRKMKPDLVLLDIMLPTMNGYEILEVKANDPSIKDVPVIVISNSGQPVELQRTLKLGVKEYFIKAQFDPEEVLEKVKSVLPLPEGAGVSLAGKKVLIIEDDHFLSDVLVKKIADTGGGTVLYAGTGEDGLRSATENHPDIILLDLILPNMSGFDVLKQVKEKPETKDIPVIILSNLSQKEDMDKARELGAVQFMVKAMSTPRDVFAAVQATLQNH